MKKFWLKDFLEKELRTTRGSKFGVAGTYGVTCSIAHRVKPRQLVFPGDPVIHPGDLECSSSEVSDAEQD